MGELMARIRSVKPELRTSYLVASWSRDVRYFWVLLWGYLDDYGRGLDIPKAIAGDCFPLDDDIDGQQVDDWLSLMGRGLDNESGPVCRYTVAGKRYVHAVNWHEHQKPNRPTPSRLPPCPIHEARTDRLSEGFSEPPYGNSLPGAAEQGSRGAEEQQRGAHESRTEKFTDGMRRTVLDATDATEAEADAVIEFVRTDRKPRSLGAFLKRLAEDGDLKDILADIRRANTKADASRLLEQARASPPCDHGQPGGNLPHPASGEPICPQCRFAARQPAA